MKNHYQVNLPQVRQYTVKGIYNLEQNFCYLGSKILVDELLSFPYMDPFMINSFLLTNKTSHKLQSTPRRFNAVVKLHWVDNPVVTTFLITGMVANQ